MAKTRDLYWDSLKLVLIFCVMYGHIVQPYRADSQFNMTTFNFIYSFHMPLFVFISGRFSHFSDRDRYKKGILRIIETLVVFHLIRCLMQILQGGMIHPSMFTTPSYALWYLAALAYWRILVLIVPDRWKNRPLVMLTVSVCISLIAPFIPGNLGKLFVVERSMNFLPFFVMGYYSTGMDVRKMISGIRSGYALLYLVMLFICLFLALRYYAVNTATIVHYSYTYWTDSMAESFERIGIRLLYIPFTIITSIMVMRVIHEWKIINKMGGGNYVYLHLPHVRG